jgi:3-hydroxyacyl-CoA dehydrogenase
MSTHSPVASPLLIRRAAVLGAGTTVSKQYILDLEREAFLSLCGEPKTQERIAFTMKTGKPLRN